MKFGLTARQHNELGNVFRRYLPEGKVIVYGSRAKGNYTHRSDIDLVIAETENINHDLLEKIKDAIEDSDFPYLVDLQILNEIKNIKLLEHIERIGKQFFVAK